MTVISKVLNNNVFRYLYRIQCHECGWRRVDFMGYFVSFHSKIRCFPVSLHRTEVLQQVVYNVYILLLYVGYRSTVNRSILFLWLVVAICSTVLISHHCGYVYSQSFKHFEYKCILTRNNWNFVHAGVMETV